MPIGGQRTKTIEDGIVKREDSPGQVYIDYQPGNGTRYPLLFVRIEPGHAGQVIGFGSDGGWMITWIGSARSKSMFISDCTFVHVNYIREKLALNDSDGDAICIAEIIGHILGLGSTVWTDYEPELDNEIVVCKAMES
jgi:hypothetical protein